MFIFFYNSFLVFLTHFWINKKWDKSLPFTAKYVPTFYDFLVVWFLFTILFLPAPPDIVRVFVGLAAHPRVVPIFNHYFSVSLLAMIVY